jgi:hypothetical protein
MSPSIFSSRLTAWVALMATLFSAISPGVAATLLSGRAEALARMLGMPAEERSIATHVAHHHENAPVDNHGQKHDHEKSAPHDGHGIYCSFCLNASSTCAVHAGPAAIAFLKIEYRVQSADTRHTFVSAFRPLYRSRGPPA